ncbi:MAG: hypothetical protein II008_14180 [Oscillospiraceae bacterium]|nr:hypothetical protein [Oscillospiraceae bacterium]
MKEYVVIELCKDTEGKMTPSVYSYEDIADARALYYNKCATAVKSAYLTHTIMLVNSAGVNMEPPKCFRHEPVAPQQDGGDQNVEPEGN